MQAHVFCHTQTNPIYSCLRIRKYAVRLYLRAWKVALRTAKHGRRKGKGRKGRTRGCATLRDDVGIVPSSYLRLRVSVVRIVRQSPCCLCDVRTRIWRHKESKMGKLGMCLIGFRHGSSIMRFLCSCSIVWVLSLQS